MNWQKKKLKKKKKKIKNLTEMAFMNAGDQDKFINEFNKNMDVFLKS